MSAIISQRLPVPLSTSSTAPTSVAHAACKPVELPTEHIKKRDGVSWDVARALGFAAVAPRRAYTVLSRRA